MSKLARDEEEELIARSQRGDVAAFNQLVLRYQQIVYSAVYRVVGDPDTAADVTQDAFLAAFRGIHSYRGGASFRAWLLPSCATCRDSPTKKSPKPHRQLSGLYARASRAVVRVYAPISISTGNFYHVTIVLPEVMSDTKTEHRRGTRERASDN